MEPCDFWWLVGLLEAEGSFLGATPSRPGIPRVVLTTTDADVAERVARLLSSACNSRQPSNSNHKRIYSISLSASRAVDLMQAVRAHMSVRRQAQIDRALQDMPKRRFVAPMKLPQPEWTANAARHWAAGVIEGEGYITAGFPSKPAPCLEVHMTDADTIAKLGEIVGATPHRRASGNPKWKSTSYVRLRGRSATRVLEWLLPLLGARRAQSASAALENRKPAAA